MNRFLTFLNLAAVALIAHGRRGVVQGAEVTTTMYVGRHFEVRDHDQPVKYVFNENERVARVTGPLSNRERVQRLRLQHGWNLISLAVTVTNLVGQLENLFDGPSPLVSALYRWRPTTHDFGSVGQNVEAGTVLWLRAEANAVVSIVGVYGEPMPLLLGAGGGFVASPGLESWSPWLLVGVTTWKYDAAAGRWMATFSSELESAGDVPPTLAPGDAIFVHASEAVELAQPETDNRLLFYHSDHLGSAAAVSDIAGVSVEETAHHPFGAVRHQHHARAATAHYGFTQKEQDRESGLHYFETRYVVSSLGRFPSFDPMLKNMEALAADDLKKLLIEPARLHPFAYALNNPTRYVDPDGRESRDASPRPRNRTPARQPAPRPRQPVETKLQSRLTIRLGPPSKRPGEIAGTSVALNPRPRVSPTAKGTQREASIPSVSEIQVTRLVDDASTELFKTHLHGKNFESVQVIIPGQDGSEYRIQMENVLITSMSTYGGAGMGGETGEMLTFNATKITFGDPVPPAPSRPSRSEWMLDTKGQ